MGKAPKCALAQKVRFLALFSEKHGKVLILANFHFWSGNAAFRAPRAQASVEPIEFQ